MTSKAEGTLPAMQPDDPCAALPRQELGSGFAMLDGVRVIDLSTSIAAPYATMMLADMGAEVIKIERPGSGDDARGWGPPFRDGESLWFLSVNRNKRSLTLDITREPGRRIFTDLVSKADVLVTNQVPRVQAKLRTDYESLRKYREDLIYASLTGFGLAGERCEMPCYDLIAEGYSGVMDLTGELDGEPQKIGTPAADLLAGMDVAFSVVSALFQRARNHRGCCIDVSLVDSMTRFMTPRIVSYLGSGELPRRSGARDSVIAIYQVFHTADEPMTLGLGSDAIWSRFWEAVDEPEVARDARFATNADRRQARDELVARIDTILRRRPRAQWLERFARHKVPAGPINRLDEVANDRALIARGLFYQMEANGGSPIPQVNTGFRIDGRANQPRHAPPQLGQDSKLVLTEILGLNEAEIERLQVDGIV